MSSHFAIVHEFDATPAEFWRVFFDEPYNVEMYRRLKVKERRVLFRREDADTIQFSVRIMPARDLPGFIKKIVGGDLGYTETSTFHKGKDFLDVGIEPTLMKDRTRVKAVYTLAALSPTRVRRTFEGEIKIEVPLVGRKIEEFVIADLRRSYDVAAEVTTEWLARARSGAVTIG